MFSEHVSKKPVLHINPPLPGTPLPAVWIYRRLHEKNPQKTGGRQLVTFIKTVIKSLKKPSSSAPFHLYAVLQHSCTQQLECQHKLARFF